MKQCLTGWMREVQWMKFIEISKKAFEKVPQTMLLVKVRACGAAIWLSHLMIGGKKSKKKKESGYYITGRM